MLYEDDFKDTDDELLTDIPEDEDEDADDEVTGEEEDEEDAY